MEFLTGVRMKETLGIQQILEGDPCLLERRVLVLCGKRWHQGVVGIIAARLVERYKKPCILLSGIDEEMRGSARSVEGFSIVEVLSTCPTNWGLTPIEALQWLRDNMIPYYPLGVYQDRTANEKGVF